MKLLSPVTESTTHLTRIDDLTKIHMVLWKQIFSVVFLSMCDDMLIHPVILDDLMTGQDYLDFLQNELPKQLEDVPFGYTDCYVLSA